MIIDWMEKYRSIMLNDDQRCQREYTWGRDSQRSVIDFALVSDKLYDKFVKMKVNQERAI